MIDEKSGRPVAIEPVTEGFLAISDYYEVFDLCSKALHAFNPYSDPIDIESLQSRFSEWRSRIITLLNHHQIQLAGIEDMLVVIMQAAESGEIQMTEFTRLDD